MKSQQRLIQVGAADWQVTGGKGRLGNETLKAIACLLAWSNADFNELGCLADAIRNARKLFNK